MSKRIYEAVQVNCEPIARRKLDEVERLRSEGRRGGLYVSGWPAMLEGVDGDDRSGLDYSKEPFDVYDGDDLGEALSAAREWLESEKVEIYGGGGLERVCYSVADILWAEDDDDEDYESMGGIVTLATWDNLPTELDAAWHRALKSHRIFLDYEDDWYLGLESQLELADVEVQIPDD